jgi:thermitase
MLKQSKLSIALTLLGALLAAGCGHVDLPAGAGSAARPAIGMAEDTDGPPAGAEPDEATLQAPPNVVPDQLIVQVQPGTRVVLAADDELRPIREFDMGYRYQVVRIPAGMSRDEAIARLQHRAGVRMVAPNRIYSATFTPSDTMFNQQWGLDRIGAKSAWDKGVSASGVTVAVLDTGVDYNHPELKGRVIKGPDLADQDDDPRDVHGHGTHVSGIIGAAGNNNEGIAGVAWNCKILAVKVLSDNGNGTTDAVVEGIRYAADHGARVINMSLGTGAKDTSIDPVLHYAMEYAYKKGVVIVAAAGNEHGQVTCPANDPYAIAVSSTSAFWKFEWLSMFSNKGEKVEVAAPGGGIWSLFPTSGAKMGRNYGKLSGTSMAAPFVSGEAALIIAQHPTWTPAQVRARIDSAVDDKGSAGRDDKYGYGRINLAKALD